MAVMDPLRETLPEQLVLGQVEVRAGEAPSVRVRRAPVERCHRCRRRRGPVDGEQLCDRCRDVVASFAQTANGEHA
jgi:hypothetical protein